MGGTESREGLSVRPFLDEDAFKRMPRRSFLITNPLPDELVCEHDLVFCLVYSQQTWTSLKAVDSPFTHKPSPLSKEMKQMKAQKEAQKVKVRVTGREQQEQQEKPGDDGLVTVTDLQRNIDD